MNRRGMGKIKREESERWRKVVRWRKNEERKMGKLGRKVVISGWREIEEEEERVEEDGGGRWKCGRWRREIEVKEGEGEEDENKRGGER